MYIYILFQTESESVLRTTRKLIKIVALLLIILKVVVIRIVALLLNILKVVVVRIVVILIGSVYLVFGIWITNRIHHITIVLLIFRFILI